MNKGLKLRFCPQCNKKKFCSRIHIPGHNYRFTCNKRHTWVIKGITAERVVLIMQEVLTPEKVKSLFERDDIFYRSLKR